MPDQLTTESEELVMLFTTPHRLLVGLAYSVMLSSICYARMKFAITFYLGRVEYVIQCKWTIKSRT